ncbi:PQQ-binding-like beta-propeller repeat protein [Streptomyces sp. NBC_01794]|uniref:outer membrane protein assembly factor BamB family protein n=1 Tax=Streptomyces sp. NBC_01794 TaxID=2975942 RepID=UPI00308BF144|nr:PQQ-binding-like beta-propeller repeat protein [Streptomyces sp. NBC_01794]
MEPLQQDDPRQIGPFTTLARHRDSAVCVRYLAHGPDGVTAVVSVARPELAALTAFRRRFRSETRRTQRLAGGWVAPIASSTDGADGTEGTEGTDVADGEPLWTASPYVPALTLREAIALAGPLPERAVRILGAALAETLSRVHATGAVLHGLAPDTVLLAADGPRLTALGALGAAAVAEAHPDGQLTVKLGYLTPEQATGAKPGPASDIFVLGLLLAYASTGTTPLADADRIAHGEPELGGVPDELRPLVARCLSKSPEDRPSAGTVAADLALEGAAALAREGWLPPGLVAAVEEQAAQVMALGRGDAWNPGSGPVPGPDAGPDAGQSEADLRRAGAEPVDAVASLHAGAAGAGPGSVRDADTLLVGSARNAPGDGGPGEGARVDRVTAALAVPAARSASTGTAPAVARPPVAPSTAAPFPTAPLPTPHLPAVPLPAARLPAALPPAAPAPDRRALLTGIAGAAAGLVVGGGLVYAIAAGDADKGPARAAPAPRRTRVAGLPPEPVWRYAHPATAAALLATVWQDRVLVLTGEESTGVDLRTGRRLWQRKEAASASRAVPVDDALCFVDTPDAFLWIAAQDGQVKHRIAKATSAGPGEVLTLTGRTGLDGTTLWMTGQVKKGAALQSYLLAYDLTARKWLWRTRIPGAPAPHAPQYQLIAVRPAEIVVRQYSSTLTPAQRKAANGASVLLAFDRKTGKQLKSLRLAGIHPAAALVGDESGRLFAPVADRLNAHTISGGALLWRLAPADTAPGESGVFVFGGAIVRSPMLYVANRHQQVSAVDTANGRLLWRRSTDAPVSDEIPGTGFSTSGRTVLAYDSGQLTAFAARDGKRLWKFQETGAQDSGTGAPRYEPLAGGGRNLVVRRDRTFYALPVD